MRTIRAIASGMRIELVRKKDFYVLFIFLIVLMLFLSSQQYFQIEGIARYIRDFGYTMVMLFSFIIAVTFAAKQIPSEIESRTIYPLLAKPLSRYAVVLGKFCGASAVAILSFSIFFGTYAFFYKISGGGSAILLWQAFFFGALFLALTSALVVFFSNFLTVSANVTLNLLAYAAILGFSAQLRELVLYSKGLVSAAWGSLFYLLPHFDFYDLRIRITHEWDPLAAWVVISVTVYTLVYCFMLLYFAGLIFRRKKL
jgi:ABC-type transport system involved in multi-copper enzyme maturation permease subunit